MVLTTPVVMLVHLKKALGRNAQNVAEMIQNAITGRGSINYLQTRPLCVTENLANVWQKKAPSAFQEIKHARLNITVRLIMGVTGCAKTTSGGLMAWKIGRFARNYAIEILNVNIGRGNILVLLICRNLVF